jgi:RNA polymerase sigma-70 factor (ECF subfamily)
VASDRIAAVDGPDWIAVVDRLCAGDRLAFLELNRLVTNFLVQLRAYDFRDEWDDLRQEVVTSVVENARAGRLRDAQAFVAYVRIVTRNKFVDRLKARLRHHEKETLPWDEETARVAVPPEHVDGAADVWATVRGLPADQQRVVESIYRLGHTYEAAATHTGIPLGTLKRRLRDALTELRRRLRAETGSGADLPGRKPT